MNTATEPKVEVRLYPLMAEKNIRTIKELNARTGISRSVLSDILNGKRVKLRFDTIAKLCKELDCEISDLIVLRKEGSE